MIVSGHFNKIFSTDCDLSDPKITGGRLIVFVQGIGVIPGHPFFEKIGPSQIRYFRSGHLIFDGVEDSLRELTDFVGDPRDRKVTKPYVVKDGPFPKPAQATQVFRFEGRPKPHAWVDWTVMAVSFTLEILDARQPPWDPVLRANAPS
jgi:hypothetical protein